MLKLMLVVAMVMEAEGSLGFGAIGDRMGATVVVLSLVLVVEGEGGLRAGIGGG